jgi:hypothetical protein
MVRLRYPFRMLDFVTSLFKVEPQYGKYLKLAGILLVLGYIFLLTFIFVAFNKYDRQSNDPEFSANATSAQRLEIKKARSPFGDRAKSTSVRSEGGIQFPTQ